jgi:hypothetical protein
VGAGWANGSETGVKVGVGCGNGRGNGMGNEFLKGNTDNSNFKGYNV